ncbi:MAG: hypothetical protein HN704_08465 [Bacteroidetes bacterium]|nr:hypothetical protein [Bacteroidota bacterium]
MKTPKFKNTFGIIKLISQMAIIITAVLIINQLIRKSFVSKTWGNFNVHIKTKYIKEKGDEFNTYFIGSSTIYRHLMPSVFDEEIDPDLEVRSFNLGTGRFAPPETYIYYEYLINEEDLNIDYVIIELRDIFKILDENLHTARASYWYTPSAYLFAIKSLMSSKSFESSDEKSHKIKNHTISFAENVFNFGLIKSYVRALQKEYELNERKVKSIIGEFDDGFKGYYVEDLKKGKNEYYKRDPARLQKKLNQMEMKYNKYDRKSFDCNLVHLYEINRLIELSEEKGIHLIFFLNPKIAVKQYEEYIPLMQQIDDEHKIELADCRFYPELYSLEYAYDNNHLNIDGVRIITKLAAKKFNEIVRNKKY